MIDASFIPKDTKNCRAAYAPDGSLSHYGYYEGETCIACLDLRETEQWAQFRKGIAGEEFLRGTIQPIGPFAGSGPSRSATESYESWIRARIAEIAALGS